MRKFAAIVWVVAGVLLALPGCGEKTRRAPEVRQGPPAASAGKDPLGEAADVTWNTTKAVVEAPVKAFTPRPAPKPSGKRETYEAPEAIIVPRDQAGAMPIYGGATTRP